MIVYNEEPINSAFIPDNRSNQSTSAGSCKSNTITQIREKRPKSTENNKRVKKRKLTAVNFKFLKALGLNPRK